MRWILIFLLLLNIAVFAWFWRAGKVGGDSVSGSVASGEQELAENSIPTLVLLSELGSMQQSATRAAEPVVVAELPTSCYAIGPFTGRPDAQQFLDVYSLQEQTAQDQSVQRQLSLEERQIPLRTDYRVYLPPAASREIAANTLREVQARLAAANLNIDNFLITQGELENGIALGLFSERNNALNVERQLGQLGFAVVIAEEPRTQNEFWVAVEEPPQSPQLMALWPEITAQRSYLQRTEKLCETIAHEEQFP